MQPKYEETREEIQDKILQQVDYTREVTDEEIQSTISNVISNEPKLKMWKVEERKKLAKDIFSALRRWDILQNLLEDNAVTEIMVNGTEGIYIERSGQIIRLEERFRSKEKLRDIIQRIAAGCNRMVNESSPIVDARLENGARVNIVLEPVAINGPAVTIRRFPEKPMTMEMLLKNGSVSEEAARFLEAAVKARYNIFISGGTGSGKTTFLNVLSNFIPPQERVITIEDSAELQLQGIENLIRLETRNENVEGCRPITIRDLIRTSLRMRPDRIIVGEVRGEETIDMIQCLNTGHDGSMSTGHGNSARDILSRLETMILMGVELPLAAIRQQIASGIDIIVHLGRLRDRSRRVLEIYEVDQYREGNIALNPLFSFRETGEEDGKITGRLEPQGEPVHMEKFQAAGVGLSPKDALVSG